MSVVLLIINLMWTIPAAGYFSTKWIQSAKKNRPQIEHVEKTILEDNIHEYEYYNYGTSRSKYRILVWKDLIFYNDDTSQEKYYYQIDEPKHECGASEKALNKSVDRELLLIKNKYHIIDFD